MRNLLFFLFLSHPLCLSWKKYANDFEARWQFPHCIVAIDGKRINIECPNLSGSEFQNYKFFFSIILLAVTEASYKFVYVDIGAPGSDSDGGIFASSSLDKSFEQKLANLPPPEPIINGGSLVAYFLLGDEAFPLKNYLMKPYVAKKLNRLPQEFNDEPAITRKIYNYRQARARRFVENGFEILAKKWRIFRRPIVTNHETITEIVNAAYLLHNFMQMQDCSVPAASTYCPPSYTDSDTAKGIWRNEGFGDHLQSTGRIGSNNPSRSAIDNRDQFVSYFVSLLGQIPYQWVRINRGKD
ncbi:hypothetical protein QYM36_001341 [Artemia franciscana]|uniref:DDE Tnp4 domain-containing protein n=1 Tax=Artemia franciscana TaxID=6661 RepID=A0AA88IDU5_ARTSF|nr:hypothetical protein QYM36_001341 [Artemia franciscana]